MEHALCYYVNQVFKSGKLSGKFIPTCLRFMNALWENGEVITYKERRSTE